MPRPRIFISHSAKEERTSRVLNALEAALEAEGFEVFLDRVRLQPNDTWREEILRWPLQCHASVILFSQAVLSHPETGKPSRWVKVESGLLISRRHVSKQFGGDFQVLPVYFDPVTPQSLAATDFEPLDIPEIQAVPSDTDEAIVTKIVERLRPLRERFGDLNKLGTLPGALHTIIDKSITPQTRDSFVETLAEKLGADVRECPPGSDKLLWLIGKMLRSDFRKLRGAVQIVGPALGQQRTQWMCSVVAPFCWVDEEAAGRILEVLSRPEGTRAVGLNSGKARTATHYVWRASTQFPFWNLKEYEGGGSAAQLEEFVESTRANVKSFLGIPQEDEVADQQLNKILADEFEDGRPLFILVPPPLPDRAVVQGALRAFPHVTLLLLTGNLRSVEFRDLNIPHAEFLLPELDEEGEQDAEYAYNRLVDFVKNMNIPD